MNWKNLFFISTAFWIGAIVLMNCTSPKPPAAPEITDANITYCDKNPKKCGDIKSQIDGYEDMLDGSRLKIIRGEGLPIRQVEIPDSVFANELELLQGFRFSGEEFRQMGHLAKKKSADDKVFVMFAINKDPKSIAHRGSSPIKYLDIYFQVKTKEGGMAMYDRKGEAFDDYGDFPDPCPVVCP